MPNWCVSSTAIYGNEEQVKELWSIIEKETSEERTIKTPNSWGQDWLGNIFYYFYNDKEIEKKNIRCRGSFIDKTFGEDEQGSFIMLTYETAWSPNYDSWEQLFADFFPDLKQVTRSEECGCEIYINTDIEGRFFPDKYVLDCCYQGDYYNDYFASDEELLKYIKENFGEEFKSVKQLQEDQVFQESFNVEDSDFFNLHQYETE